MCYNQWHRVGAFSLFVDKMNSKPVNVSLEMGERIDELFLGAPIELGFPVIHQLLDVIKVAAVIPS